MARKPAPISILHFDAHLISCLRVSGESRELEVLAFEQEMGQWSPEDGSLSKALRQFAARLNLGEDDVYSILPRYEITTRILTLPSHDMAEIQSMVRLGAEEYVPYSAAELVIDQCILHKDPGGEAQVLVALAHRDVVEGHLGLLREAGLDPRQIYLSTACLASGALAAPAPGQERYALADIATSGLEVLVIQGARLLFSRGVGAAQHWQPAGVEQDRHHELALEVRSSLSAFRRESLDGVAVDTVYVCSESVDVVEAAKALANETGKECAPANFALELVGTGREHLKHLPLASIGAALAARGRAAVTIQLIPSAVHQRRALVGVQSRLMRMCLAGIAVLLMGAAVFAQRLWQQQNMIEMLQGQVSAIAPQAEGIKTKRDQLQILRRQVDRSASVLEMMAAIASAAPDKGVNINRIRYERASGMDLWGRAVVKDAVYLFAQRIRELGVGQLALLAEAHSVYESAGKERDKPVFDYQISIPFPEEEADELAAAAQ